MLGRLEYVGRKAGWARPSGPFLGERKNRGGLPMRQLRSWSEQWVVVGRLEQDGRGFAIGLQQEEEDR